MPNQWKNESRDREIEITLAEFDPAAVGVDVTPLVSGHRARRRELPMTKTPRYFGRIIFDAHNRNTSVARPSADCSPAASMSLPRLALSLEDGHR
jgi:hypothetical protein